MQRVHDEASVTTMARALRRADRPALGILLTLPIAVMLWLLIILAVFEISRWLVPA